jgi:hypothetical protein
VAKNLPTPVDTVAPRKYLLPTEVDLLMNHARKHSRCGFNPHKVIGFIDSNPAIVGNTPPIWSDDGKENIGVIQCVMHGLTEINSEMDSVGILEYRLLSIPMHQPIIDTASRIRVSSSV